MNNINNTSFLRTSREFPEDIKLLANQINKTYVDIANAVNGRTISLFTTNVPSVNGEQWFISGNNRRQQGSRKAFTFTSALLTFPHGINFNQIYGFTRIYGTFTDDTNWYPLPYVDVVSATNQINLVITPTNIVITEGAGSPPGLISGFVVLEWIAQP